VDLSVIIPAHNPDPDRLRRVLLGLRAQTLPATRWETVIVDNASDRFPDPGFFGGCAPENFSTVAEPIMGLTAARRRGFCVARGEVGVLVDDDNVLAPDYLAQVLAIFASHPRIGVAGGKSIPDFAGQPPPWTPEFFPLLALRDLGEQEIVSKGLRAPDDSRNEYPSYAPIGAGMALRRAAWTNWLNRPPNTLSDRRGQHLSSAGDNDIVFCALKAGWEVGYFPALKLTHLIPAARLQTDYLSRLNYGIQKSWMQVLALHEASPWPPLTSFGAQLRMLKAWFAHRPWSSPAAHVRWRGACGHFEGRIKA
jgi:glycosyltransferase involved in cell wall biosynthesis